jgi:hypothetical protein
MISGRYLLMLKRLLSISLLVTLIFSGFMANPPKPAHAHIFSSDESASFLALVEQIKVESQLAASSGGTSQEHARHASVLLDADIAEEISERNSRIGTDLPAALKDLESLTSSLDPDEEAIKAKVVEIDDLLAEAISVRIDRQQLRNATVNALSFALLVNSVLDHYSNAVLRASTNATGGISEPVEEASTSGKYRVRASWSPPEIMAGRANTYFLTFLDGTTGEQLTGMIRYDFMFMPASDPEVMIIHRSGQTAPGGEGNQTFTFKDRHVESNIMRISGYGDDVDFPMTVLPPYSASSGNTTDGSIINLTEYQTAQALTDRIQELFEDLKMSVPANSTDTLDLVEDGIMQLKLAIDEKASIEDVEVLVHGQIHSNLQQLFNLRIIPEFPLPLLIVSVLGGVVAATRLVSRRRQ